jgi:chitodextrinase
MKARRLGATCCASLAVLAVAVPSASAAGSDRTPPSTPTGVRVVSVTEDSMTVTWNASTDNSGRIQSYIVYPDHWNGAGVYHPGSSTTTVLSSLVPSFTVSVRVLAVDAAGNRSAFSAPGTGTTAPDVSPPTTPGNLRMTGTTPSSVSLAWDRSSDRWGFTYQVLMDGEVVGSSHQGAERFRQRHLAPGSTHTFAVRARDNSGNLSQTSNPVTVTLPASDDTTAPTAPRNLTATTPADDFCGSNILRWEAATDNADAASALEYEIYLNGSFFSLTQPGATSAFLYTNAGTSTWTVVAVDRSGNSSAPSNPATVTVRVDVDQC